jgi:hypothetical protein
MSPSFAVLQNLRAFWWNKSAWLKHIAGHWES